MDKILGTDLAWIGIRLVQRWILMAASDSTLRQCRNLVALCLTKSLHRISTAKTTQSRPRSLQFFIFALIFSIPSMATSANFPLEDDQHSQTREHLLLIPVARDGISSTLGTHHHIGKSNVLADLLNYPWGICQTYFTSHSTTAIGGKLY